MSTTQDTTNIERLLELRRNIQTRKAPVAPDGWVPYHMTAGGQVLAGKHVDEGHVTSAFEPAGEWAQVADYLNTLTQYRALFASLSDADFSVFIARSKALGLQS
jgi:hypothetical protein